ncbi:Pkinase-domain-containing protein [Abortiporus biennis]|nr:Pkinase-domain-containing protein [Abortiporus biennis]
MSAQVYSNMPPPPRRHPLANHQAATNQVPQAYQQRQPGTPIKQQQQPPQVPEKQKQPQVQATAQAPSSPPLPRQNAKVTPPSPPRVIVDKHSTLQFVRVGLLGEGGFARVYEVKDIDGERVACKVVTKSSLKTKKAKTKLYAEIKIHKSLDHPNIVQFQECFEDDENVYMTLELCHNGSLMDLLRRRRRFTEPEARYFMIQLLGACHYMHTHQVIHRDLKLGNIFLDSNMNVKVGDFGLAALIENPGERKKTICGTPNYIAPEVLFDTANGHSFEVDTWSIGVILYTLVVGRPPFQTKDVKAIYKRIRDNEYEFPADRPISIEAQDLIQQILTPDPSQRPTLHEILDHRFFTHGIIPAYIPHSVHDQVPDFRGISRRESDANLRRLRRKAKIDDETTVNNTVRNDSGRGGDARSGMTSLAQQEKEFQKAVQPGSPISALLSSARQPLIVAPLANNGAASPAFNAPNREQPLIRKLQQVARERERQQQVEIGKGQSPAKVARTVPSSKNLHGLHGIQEEEEEDERALGKKEEEQRRKELESQKARIVAQMVPQHTGTGTVVSSNDDEVDYQREEQENVPPEAYGIRRIVPEKEKVRTKDREREHHHQASRQTAGALPTSTTSSSVPSVPSNPSIPTLRPNSFDAAAQTLTYAFECRSAGKVFRDPRHDANLPPTKVFMASWVDYCNKYGMGYALTDGSVGVHFNDSTSLVLAADKSHMDYISSRRQGSVYVRKNYTVSEYPEDLKNKVYLLKHFEKYIMDRLYGDYDFTYQDLEKTKGMDFVQKYLRMKHVIVFKMSHDVLQFNFYDHTKVILSSQGLLVTYIDKNYNLSRFPLSQIMYQSVRPSSRATEEDLKFNQRLVDKLKYCKEVLVSIRNASANLEQHGTGNGEEGAV